MNPRYYGNYSSYGFDNHYKTLHAFQDIEATIIIISNKAIQPLQHTQYTAITNITVITTIMAIIILISIIIQ